MIFIVISSPAGDTGEPEIANHLFESGLRLFHLRKPDWDEAQMRWYIERIEPQYHSRIALHSHHDLASELSVGGLHFPEWSLHGCGDVDDFQSMEYWKEQRPDLRLSTSFHSLTDLEHEESPSDYVFFSPVFASVSKPGHRPLAEPHELQAALRRMHYNVVGLGGITAATVERVADLGFAGCAVLGSVWQSGDPVQNCRELLEAVDRIEEKVSSVP